MPYFRKITGFTCFVCGEKHESNTYHINLGGDPEPLCDPCFEKDRIETFQNENEADYNLLFSKYGEKRTSTDMDELDKYLQGFFDWGFERYFEDDYK
jgi:hypothetical protein